MGRKRKPRGRQRERSSLLVHLCCIPGLDARFYSPFSSFSLYGRVVSPKSDPCSLSLSLSLSFYLPYSTSTLVSEAHLLGWMMGRGLIPPRYRGGAERYLADLPNVLLRIKRRSCSVTSRCRKFFNEIKILPSPLLGY